MCSVRVSACFSAVLIFVGCGAGPGSEGGDAGGTQATCPEDASLPGRPEACILFSLANQDRAAFPNEADQAGALLWNGAIAAVAQAHAQDMCNRGYFAHENPEGLDPSARAQAAGLDFGLSENIAAHFDPDSMVYAWMREPTCTGHRGNILDARAVEVGIGYVLCDNPNTSFGQHHHAVQNFRLDFNRDRGPFCTDPLTHCEVPPDPPSVAQCSQLAIDSGLCPAPDAGLLSEWSCPAD